MAGRKSVLESTNDAQLVELLGRNRLIAELAVAGIEVALPVRDRGVDLIAYVERKVKRFASLPIQLKAARSEAFSIDKKYARTADLLIAYVWNVAEPRNVTYALTYGEALKVAESMRYTQAESWWHAGRYVTSKPSQALRQQLEPFRMTPDAWRKRLVSQAP